jgi:hypothetical protein
MSTGNLDNSIPRASRAGSKADPKNASARRRVTPAATATSPAATPRDPVRDEAMRVKVELDRSNAILKRLLRELEDRGPNGPGVPQIWESVRQAATTSDQLIQRLDRLRADLARRA